MAYDFKRAFRLDRTSRAGARDSVHEELNHHIDLCVDELVEAGWNESDARREALRQFGDLKSTEAYCAEMQTRKGRGERRMVSFEEVFQDLKYALRAVRKSPGYAGLVVITLAFGIAANTTIFSVMNPYLFRPLPFGAPDELVQVNQINPTTGWDMDRFSYPQYRDWEERTRAFESLGAYTYSAANVTDREGPEQIQYASLSANMFEVLAAQPTLGRTFRPEEGLSGSEPVVVLSDGLWQRRYAADPDIIGRTITLDGTQRTVVGVMPADFNFPFGGVKLWIPIQADRTSSRTSMPYHLVGRLNTGWTVEQVKVELGQIQTELGARDAGDFGTGLSAYRKALEVRPGDPRVLHALGQMHSRSGAYPLAIQAIRESLSVDAAQPLAWVNLGIALAGNGDPVGARGAYEEALVLNPHEALAHFNLGNAHQRAGRLEEAAAAYRSAVAADPGLGLAHFELGRTYIGLERFEDALRHARRAVEFLPDHTSSAQMLADLERALGNG
ncbi:MAG: tetratricopeptide repeat protein [Gemmatimonadetes bacterium]|nr:tetratricopeptide repeat protein [Gemmatimonadota bacterium]MDA1104462.1 tetratricopeptide repeat protein [Gemmatimonadota bacterium]